VRTEQLQQEFDLKLRWTVFPLHPETPEQGQTLEQLFAGRIDVPSVLARLKQVADSLNLPFGSRTHTYNSRRAQELGKWAEQQGRGDVFRAGIYRAYFVDGRNIANPTELAVIIAALGLSVTEALKVLDEQTYAGAVDDDWHRAHNRNVSSVPTYRYENRALVGFQDYAALRQLISN
jgi:predicted DsbA family dithiol-disulfide isomerase